MNCPLCVDAVLDVTYHAGIELDICPRCKGVWLDRGELERIAGVGSAAPTASGGAASAASPRPAPGPAPDDDGWSERSSGRDDRRGRPPKSRKRRFAERLGDVFEEVLDL